MLRRSILFAALCAALPLASLAAEPVLKPGDRVAIVGDSITEQKLYSKYVECYLLACSGVPDLKVMQYGWSGERANGFADRLENDLAGLQADRGDALLRHERRQLPAVQRPDRQHVRNEHAARAGRAWRSSACGRSSSARRARSISTSSAPAR